MMPRKGKLWTVSKEELTAVIDKCSSVAKVLKSLGTPPRSSRHYSLFKSKVKEFGIDTAKLRAMTENARAHSARFKSKISLTSRLKKNSTYGRGHLKAKLIRDGLLSEVCVECGLGTEWHNKKLVLVLDHKNGNSIDNRISNLRLLCPNCNSQTDTFSGRRKRYKK